MLLIMKSAPHGILLTVSVLLNNREIKKVGKGSFENQQDERDNEQ